MYPRLKDAVSLGTYTGEDPSKVTSYFAQNASGQEFKISKELYQALLCADGTHRLNVHADQRKLIRLLKKCDLITTSRFISGDILNQFIVVPLGQRVRTLRPLCRIIATILPVLSFLALAAGIVLRMYYPLSEAHDMNMAIYYGAILLSITMHEFGHFTTSVAFGYETEHAGLLLLGIFPIGAYVSFLERERKNYRHMLRISLAGVEMNFLIAGLCLLLDVLAYPQSLTFFCIAIMNLVLAVSNLLPVSGLDGEAALSSVLQVNSIGKAAERFFFNNRGREKFLHSGLPGIACCALFSLTYVAKTLMVLLNIVGIAFTVFCFLM